jgi:hypothetical protein
MIHDKINDRTGSTIKLSWLLHSRHWFINSYDFIVGRFRWESIKYDKQDQQGRAAFDPVTTDKYFKIHVRPSKFTVHKTRSSINYNDVWHWILNFELDTWFCVPQIVPMCYRFIQKLFQNKSISNKETEFLKSKMAKLQILQAQFDSACSWRGSKCSLI